MDPSSPTPAPGELLHVFWHEGMLGHDPGTGIFDTGQDPGFLEVLEKHPENADRVKNMVSILQKGPISPHISWHTGKPAQISELLSFHTPEYIGELVQANKYGGKKVCFGTFMNPGSWDACLLAAGSTLSAMKFVLNGHGKLAYALVRPPGHHAQPSRADGYCFLNNVGLAVQLALDSGCQKVVVIDIDVHYGNGTAEGFYHSNKVLTISLHMNHGSWGPSHTQSGSIDEAGEGDGFGYNLNIPLPNGTGDEGYTYAMEELVVPAIGKFRPNIVILVVGQDSSAFDPNGRQCLTMAGYRKIGQISRFLSDQYAEGCLLVVQEGGYHLTYSAYCLHATLEGVLNLPGYLLADPIAYYPEDKCFTLKVVDAIKQYWKDNIPFLNDALAIPNTEMAKELPTERPIWGAPSSEPAGTSELPAKRAWGAVQTGEHPFAEFLNEADSFVECNACEFLLKEIPAHIPTRADNAGLREATLLTGKSDATKLGSQRDRVLCQRAANLSASSLLYTGEMARRNMALRQDVNRLKKSNKNLRAKLKNTRFLAREYSRLYDEGLVKAEEAKISRAAERAEFDAERASFLAERASFEVTLDVLRAKSQAALVKVQADAKIARKAVLDDASGQLMDEFTAGLEQALAKLRQLGMVAPNAISQDELLVRVLEDADS